MLYNIYTTNGELLQSKLEKKIRKLEKMGNWYVSENKTETLCFEKAQLDGQMMIIQFC